MTNGAFGEGQANDKEKNLRGQLYQHFNGSGMQQINEYDFKGNPLETEQKLLDDPELTDADCSGTPPALSIEVFTSSVTYDALNRPVTTTDSGSNVHEFTYDKGGLLNSVKLNTDDYVNDIHYNAKGQRQAIWYGNGTKTSYTYDPETFRLRRLLTVNVDSGNPHYNEKMQDLNYWYDPVGNITEIQDDAQQTLFYDNSVVAPTQKFTYDALYRLIKAKGRELIGTASFGAEDNWNDAAWQTTHKGDGNAVQNYTQQYTYDEVGNILQVQHIAGTGSYTRDYTIGSGSNRMEETQVGMDTYSYIYDTRGNMSEMPHLDNMKWNISNELYKTENGTMEAYYQYSGGQRIRKWVDKGNIKEERIYLGSFEIYRKFESSSLKVERQTVHVSDDTGRIAMLEKRTYGSSGDDNGTDAELTSYIYSNHLQSASLELDESGDIISYEEYHSYGTTSYQATNASIKAVAKRYRYCSAERDEESGLYMMGARYYASWLCRWLSPDPINNENYNLQKGYGLEKNGERDFIELTISPYCYCANNPANKIDPNGEKEFKNYNEYKAYQQQNKQEVLAKDKIGDQGHWLKADRTGNTAVWDAANWHNIKNEKEGQYAPFEQIRDLYKWVRKEAKNQGHDVRWMMGADLLVSELPMIDYFSSLLPAGFNDLMKELNLNIANFAIHKFKELLVDRGEQNPIIGAEAYLWDKEFIEVEQGKVAPPVYKKYQENYPRAIDFLNVISQKAVTDRFINSTVSMYLEIFGEIPAMEVSVMDEQYRIDFPLLMLYPNRHKPTHKEVIKHQKERKLEFMKIKFPIISN